MKKIICFLLIFVSISSILCEKSFKTDAKYFKNILRTKMVDRPQKFKGLITVYSPDKNDNLKTSYFTYRETATERYDWWPASTVKIFAAAAALQKLTKMGFSCDAEILFYYEKKVKKYKMKQIIDRAIINSDNYAFDLLVEFAGREYLNVEFLPWYNLNDTVINCSYTYSNYGAKFHSAKNFEYSPRIIIREGKNKTVVKQYKDKTFYGVDSRMNRTTLKDLTEMMKLIVMNDYLKEHERLFISKQNLVVLKNALMCEKKRGMNIRQNVAKNVKSTNYIAYNKPGYALKWFSDVVAFEFPENHTFAIVAMAGYGGRKVLDSVSLAIGKDLESLIENAE